MMSTKEEEEAVLEGWLDRARSELAAKVLKMPTGSTDAWSAGVMSALLTLRVTREVARHSRELVVLTRALVGMSVILAILTAVLIWRTFV